MALEVEGSNPFTHPIFLLERTAISCIILFRCYGPVAQLAEQGTLNPKVQGSNPCRSTMKRKGREHMLPAFFFCADKLRSGGPRERAVKTAKRAVGKRPSERSRLPAYETRCY